MTGSLVVLTGASGAGKTTLARCVEQQELTNCKVFYFDSIGIPVEQTRAEFGDEGAWQRLMTLRWIERIKTILDAGVSVLFEGQMRIAFINEGLRSTRIENAQIILIDCEDQEREARLRHDRAQPELANPRMRNWARYLREEARVSDIEVLDTTRRSIPECAGLIVQYLQAR